MLRVISRKTRFYEMFYGERPSSLSLIAMTPFFLNLSGCGTSEKMEQFSPELIAKTYNMESLSLKSMSRTSLMIKNLYLLLIVLKLEGFLEFIVGNLVPYVKCLSKTLNEILFLIFFYRLCFSHLEI